MQEQSAVFKGTFGYNPIDRQVYGRRNVGVDRQPDMVHIEGKLYGVSLQ